jgi:4-amino-4-deoxy-L-arabinose transferase-like glycosyltransferase
VIAHGRYVTTDLAVTAFYFLTVAAWFTWLKRGGWTWLAATGIALGLALGSKFSALLLVPALAVCALTAVRRRRLWVLVAGWTAVCVMGFAILAALYGPATLVAIEYPRENPYLVGFNEVRQHNTGGHPAFLLGQFSESGWWYYFPVAAALKSTLASIALVLLALPFVRRGAVLALAAACFAAALVYSGLNIGYRHALPAVPLVYALAGIGAASAIRRWRPAGAICTLLVAAHAAESLRAYPHYLPFFNIAAGGPAAGPRYLSDSNVDWGQDVKKLRAYLAGRNAMEPCISYFGNTPLRYYGIGERDVPVTSDLEARNNVNCIAAVSVTELQGVYGDPGKYAWLREREPDARIGYSIYVFDLRKR